MARKYGTYLGGNTVVYPKGDRKEYHCIYRGEDGDCLCKEAKWFGEFCKDIKNCDKIEVKAGTSRPSNDKYDKILELYPNNIQWNEYKNITCERINEKECRLQLSFKTPKKVTANQALKLLSASYDWFKETYRTFGKKSEKSRDIQKGFLLRYEGFLILCGLKLSDFNFQILSNMLVKEKRIPGRNDYINIILAGICIIQNGQSIEKLVKEKGKNYIRKRIYGVTVSNDDVEKTKSLWMKE